ncbi:MAG: hypothetical protein H0W30_11890 [Gemmatimonadaceae bacterium]|nr:hypothetical protein [Gemmatimonadaceae bacterium]MDQ3518962.1 hypothetical protein [Gemmatimonadota bacterium]
MLMRGKMGAESLTVRGYILRTAAVLYSIPTRQLCSTTQGTNSVAAAVFWRHTAARRFLSHMSTPSE